MIYYTYILKDSLILQPFYVGKGSSTRMYSHLNEAQRDGYEKRSVHYKILSILKQGGKIVYEKIEQPTEEAAFALEVELIKKYGRKDNGTGILCNLTDGGDGAFHRSRESVERTAEWHRGRKRSEESCKRMKEAQHKIVEHNLELYGMKKKPGATEKQSASSRGKSWSECARAAKRHKPTAKAVQVFNKDTKELVGEYESMGTAARELSLDVSAVWKICKGNWMQPTPDGIPRPYKSHKGYTFRLA